MPDNALYPFRFAVYAVDRLSKSEVCIAEELLRSQARSLRNTLEQYSQCDIVIYEYFWTKSNSWKESVE